MSFWRTFCHLYKLKKGLGKKSKIKKILQNILEMSHLLSRYVERLKEKNS